MSAREFTITVGETEVPCRLPMIPTRIRLVYAEADAAKLDDDGQRIYVLGCVWAAALAACLVVPPQCGSMSKFRGDVLAFGEAAGHELCEDDPSKLGAIGIAGRECLVRILESIPTAEGEEEALDPTEAPAAPSTDDSSGSA